MKKTCRLAAIRSLTFIMDLAFIHKMVIKLIVFLSTKLMITARNVIDISAGFKSKT